MVIFTHVVVELTIITEFQIQITIEQLILMILETLDLQILIVTIEVTRIIDITQIHIVERQGLKITQEQILIAIHKSIDQTVTKVVLAIIGQMVAITRTGLLVQDQVVKVTTVLLGEVLEVAEEVQPEVVVLPIEEVVEDNNA